MGTNMATSAALMAVGVKPKLFSRKAFSGEKTDDGVNKVGMTTLDAVALAAVGTSIATLVLTAGAVVSMASYMTIGFGPYAAYQKRKLKKLGDFRGQHNDLREKVNDIHIENDRLGANVDRLEKNVSKIEEVEKDLAKLADTSNVDRLVKLVKEQGEITKQMKENLKARVVHDVMSTIIRSDRNRDFMIGPMEMQELVMRLNNIGGIGFKEDKFKALLGKKKKYTLSNIMELMRNLLDDDIPEEERICELKTDDLTIE
mmetsp:Transcript_48156/g.145464  ORF Transcript_48156/g.145464 Transcript_48156/m.145464 type:complete len:258 (-) Transcript_48156:235-1008(-)